jgi:hypothetical protein
MQCIYSQCRECEQETNCKKPGYRHTGHICPSLVCNLQIHIVSGMSDEPARCVFVKCKKMSDHSKSSSLLNTCGSIHSNSPMRKVPADIITEIMVGSYTILACCDSDKSNNQIQQREQKLSRNTLNQQPLIQCWNS